MEYRVIFGEAHSQLSRSEAGHDKLSDSRRVWAFEMAYHRTCNLSCLELARSSRAIALELGIRRPHIDSQALVLTISSSMDTAKHDYSLVLLFRTCDRHKKLWTTLSPRRVRAHTELAGGFELRCEGHFSHHCWCKSGDKVSNIVDRVLSASLNWAFR